MRIERINENSISCTLTSFDLSVRNLNIRELAYGSDKAKKLFSEMMTKASSEVGFDADNTPIMIEAIPMGSNSIKLIISKVTDPEELDARFSRFTENPAFKSDPEGFLHRLTQALLEGVGNLPGFYDLSSRPDEAAVAESEEPAESAAHPETAEQLWRGFMFGELDEVIRACHEVARFDVDGTLYKNPADGAYVLIVRAGDSAGDDFPRALNIIAEFGRALRTVPNSLYYFDEHYELITAHDAVHKLGSI